MKEINVNILSKVLPASKTKSIRELNEIVNEAVELVERGEETILSFEDRLETVESMQLIPDEEDLSVTNDRKLKLKDKANTPADFSGLGRVFLRKNILGTTFDKLLPFNGFVDDVTIETFSPIMIPDNIYFDRVNKVFVATQLVFSQQEVKYYQSWNDSASGEPKAGEYMAPSPTTGFVYEGKIYTYSDDGLTESSEARKNVLIQSMIAKANTIYIIQYDYDLEGETVTIPAGCTLLFMGGSFKNGTLVGNNTKVFSLAPTSPFDNVTVSGLIMLSDAAFTGSYNDLKDKPDIYVKNEIDSAFAGKVDIGSVYDKTQMDLMLGQKASVSSLEELTGIIPAKTSDLENDSHFLTDEDVYTKQEIDDTRYNKEDVDSMFRNAGTTDQRPSDLTISDGGLMYFDKTLGKVVVVEPYNRSTGLPFDGFIKDITSQPYMVGASAIQAVYFDTDENEFVFKYMDPNTYGDAYATNTSSADYKVYVNPASGTKFSFGGKMYAYVDGTLKEADPDAVRFVDPDGFSAAPHRGTTAEREDLITAGLVSALDAGFDFYDTDLKTSCRLAIVKGEKVWLTEAGYTPARTKGKTSQRPTNLRAEFDLGYRYFDTDLGKPIHVESIENGVITWVEDDTVADLTDYYTKQEVYNKTESDERYLREHQSLSNYYNKTESDARYLQEHQSLADYLTAEQTGMAIQAGIQEARSYIPDAYTKTEVDSLLRPNAYERPTLGADDKGYRWFDVTTNKTVYWNGTKWVDEKGYTEAPNTTTLSDLSSTHAQMVAADKGYSCFLTDVKKVVYLYSVTARALVGGTVLYHVWVYADGTTALDEAVTTPTNPNPSSDS